MSRCPYVRIIQQPTYEILAPIIHAAFRNPISVGRNTTRDIDGGVSQDFVAEAVSFSEFDFTLSEFDAMAQKGAVWFGAYDGNILIGCVAMTQVSHVRARINKLAVLPEVRNKGLGSFLILHAEREAFAQGVRRMELVCQDNEAGLVDFYKRQGYKVTNEKQHRKTEQQIAYMEKRMPHLVDQVGSRVHAYGLPVGNPGQLRQGVVSSDASNGVFPAHFQLYDFEILLVYHPDEIDKPSNTGHVIQRCLPENTKEIIWHRNTIAEQLERHCGSRNEYKACDSRSVAQGDCHMTEYETVLLYPTEESVPLDEFWSKRLKSQNSNCSECSERPLRLVVLDGTWQQAQKMMVQSPALRALRAVKLANLPKSQYDLRRNQKDFGLCTLESVGEAFAEMGLPEVRDHLMKGFEAWLELGRERYK